MISHTAGPWAIVDGHYPCMKEVIGPSFKINIVMSATDLDFNDFLKRSADAQLIAAAPDLLDALKAMVDRYAPSYHDCTDDGMPSCEICDARAALKACRKGAQP